MRIEILHIKSKEQICKNLLKKLKARKAETCEEASIGYVDSRFKGRNFKYENKEKNL